ncbi:MAG: chromosomal replication initiator protein DnaA [Rickettsiales bacterium]|jgi:chromosomal replication initiator protein|nr:chromosomal replication initiator protein DnaA [Rickettsiales bacterium]
MFTGGTVSSNFPSSEATPDGWSAVRRAFREEFGNDVYNGWLSAVELVSMSEYEIVMSVPTNFIRDWILREYFAGKYGRVDGKRVCLRKGMKQVLLEHFPKLTFFDLVVAKDEEKAISEAEPSGEKADALGGGGELGSLSEHHNLYSIGLELNRSYSFENYVVGPSNRLAFEVAKNFVDCSAAEVTNLNPLFLYGGVGLGKTHLIQAIAWDLQQKDPRQQIVYLSAERFMYLFVQALHSQDINNFKNRFRSVDVLIVDDIQFITGKDKTQKEFFYTFDTLLAEGKRIVLACDRAPANLENLDEKLKSRMNGGLIVDIKEFDYQLRLDIIKRKSTDMGLDIGEDVMEFLAERVSRNCREIEGCLRRLYANQRIMGARMDRDSVRDILVDNMNQSEATVTVEAIQEKVSEFFDISLVDLRSGKRSKNFIVPRHVAMYMSKKLTPESFKSIAKKFGGRSHATVIHGINNVRKLIETDAEIALAVSRLVDTFR